MCQSAHATYCCYCLDYHPSNYLVLTLLWKTLFSLTCDTNWPLPSCVHVPGPWRPESAAAKTICSPSIRLPHRCAPRTVSIGRHLKGVAGKGPVALELWSRNVPYELPPVRITAFYRPWSGRQGRRNGDGGTEGRRDRGTEGQRDRGTERRS